LDKERLLNVHANELCTNNI